jgi:hypothetical protein
MMDGRLIRRATLQIAESDQAHIRGFRRIADFLGSRQDWPADKQSQDNCHDNCQDSRHDDRGTAPEIDLLDFGLA